MPLIVALLLSVSVPTGPLVAPVMAAARVVLALMVTRLDASVPVPPRVAMPVEPVFVVTLVAPVYDLAPLIRIELPDELMFTAAVPVMSPLMVIALVASPPKLLRLSTNAPAAMVPLNVVVSPPLLRIDAALPS